MRTRLRKGNLGQSSGPGPGPGRSLPDRAMWGSVAAGLFGQLTLVVSGPITARLLGVTARGELALLTIVAAFGSQIGAAGLPTAVAYTIAGHHTSARAIMRRVMPTWLALSAVASTLSAAVVLVLPAPQESAAWLAVLVALFVLSMMSFALIVACLQGERRFKHLNLLRPAYSTLAALALLGFLLSGRTATVTQILALLVFASIGACAVGYVVVRSSDVIGSAPSSVSSRTLLRYGLASLPGGTQPLDSLAIDQAAVGLVLSRHELGLYVVASAFNNLASILVSGLGVVALPRIAAEGDRSLRNRSMIRIAIASAGLAAGVTGGVELIVPFVLPLAFGGAFASAVPAARILVLAGFFLALRRILIVFLQALGRPGQTGVGEAVGICTLAFLALVLIPALGLIGASTALAGAAATADVYLVFALWDHNHTAEASLESPG